VVKQGRKENSIPTAARAKTKVWRTLVVWGGSTHGTSRSCKGENVRSSNAAVEDVRRQGHVTCKGHSTWGKTPLLEKVDSPKHTGEK